MTTAATSCSPPTIEFSDGISERCSCISASLTEPAKRSSLGSKVAMVVLHLIFFGGLFVSDSDLIQTTGKDPWRTAIYLVLFVATLAQYFFTAGSSPGYVIDAMIAEDGMHAAYINMSRASIQSASRNGNLIASGNGGQMGRNSRINSLSWLKLVMDLYPPGSSSRSCTCTYCNIIQPPRSKHCHDCDRCVLQFDHHCVWLGTCIGKGNHCRFWWYILEETILCIWTAIFYITFLRSKVMKAWWRVFIAVILLIVLVFCFIFLILLLLFHRGVPEKVCPFSKGICKNLYYFCCLKESMYQLEAVPTSEEMERTARPYTLADIISCRCC